MTYTTATEAGFDYLRTQLCTGVDAQLHSAGAHVIVDEADSILIDEARVPLVIAGPAAPVDSDHEAIHNLVGKFPKSYWEIDANARNIVLTASGAQHVESELQCGSLYDAANRPLLTYINLALHAQHLLVRNVDYIVRNDCVAVVDDCTGRVALDRRWPNGLQGAIEAKEGVTVHDDGCILGSITLQNFISLYQHVSGMTATASEDAEELRTIYGMKVVPIPPNRPCQRVDHPDVVFHRKDAKNDAVVAEIHRYNERGRPVLVGTASVEESESLAAAIRDCGLKCNVLNRVKRCGGSTRYRPSRYARCNHHFHQYGGTRHRHKARRESQSIRWCGVRQWGTSRRWNLSARESTHRSPASWTSGSTR